MELSLAYYMSHICLMCSAASEHGRLLGLSSEPFLHCSLVTTNFNLFPLFASASELAEDHD